MVIRDGRCQLNLISWANNKMTTDQLCGMRELLLKDTTRFASDWIPAEDR